MRSTARVLADAAFEHMAAYVARFGSIPSDALEFARFADWGIRPGNPP
jgi:hypothetical protein